MSLGAVPLALEALAGIARLRAHEGHLEQAAEPLGLALHHPASSAESHIQAEPVLAALRDALPPERLAAALARGRARDLAAVVAGLGGETVVARAA